MAGSTSIFSTVTFNAGFFLCAMLLFEILRTRHIDLYVPLSRRSHHDVSIDPGPPHPGWFGWIRQVYCLKDDTMLRLAGMDGYVLLRFLLFCTKLCIVCSLGSTVLLPLYFHADGRENSYDMNIFSMANIAMMGDRLWASFTFMYIFTFAFLYLIHQEYDNFAVARNKFLRRNTVDAVVPEQTKLTVQVENVPKEYGTGPQLKSFFEQLYPGEVLCAHVIEPTPVLDQWVAYRNRIVLKLERAVACYESSPDGRRPVIRLKRQQPHHPRGKFTTSRSTRQQTSAHNGYSYLGSSTNTNNSGIEGNDGGAAYSSDDIDEITYLSDQLLLACTEVHEARLDFWIESAARAKQTQSILIENNHPANNSENTSRSGINSHQNSLNMDNKRITGNKNNHGQDVLGAAIEQELSAIVTGAAVADDDNDDDNVGNGGHGRAANGSPAGIFGIRDSSQRMVHQVRDSVVSQFHSRTGFVTFTTRRAQVTSARLHVLSEMHPEMRVNPAPSPNNIIWENVSATPQSIDNMAFLTSAMYYAGLTGWSIVLAFIAALSNLQTFEPYIPELKYLHGWGFAIAQGLLPVFVMMLFNMLIARIMTFVSTKLVRRRTVTEVEQDVFQWQFLYQIFNVYLILGANVATTGVGTNLVTALQQPYTTVSLLSAAMPSTATFFINFILTAWLGGVPVVLLRRLDSLRMVFYTQCYKTLKLTRNQLKQGPLGDDSIDYSSSYPEFLYVLCIVLLYWVIAPLVQIAGVGYFFATYLVYKYKYTYVNVRRYESGGQFWYGLYRYSMTGLLVSTLAGIAYMSIKLGAMQAPLLAPLPLIVLFCWRATENQYKYLSMSLPLETAIHQDQDATATINTRNHADTLLDNEAVLEEDLLVGGRMGGSDGGKEVRNIRAAFSPSTTMGHTTKGMHGNGNQAATSSSSRTNVQKTLTTSAAGSVAGRTDFPAGQSQHQQQSQASSSSSSSSSSSLLLGSGSGSSLYQSPSLFGPARVFPYPHRIFDIPLLTPQGALHEVYVEDIPEGVDPEVYIAEGRLRYQPPLPPTAVGITGSSPMNISMNNNNNIQGGGGGGTAVWAAARAGTSATHLPPRFRVMATKQIRASDIETPLPGIPGASYSSL